MDHLAVDTAPVEAAGLFNETFFLKLGFSFMVGLALGFALKMAFKLVLLVVGLILLGVFALQYAGILDVNWSGLEIHYDGWVEWLTVNGGAFFDFIGGNLTSAASFTAGLVMGFRL
ncbi:MULTISPECIES: FUN14 domain-containing protein [Thiocapsa]|nr:MULTISPECIES: FUN14 domain-containing protein [Thiocapsa]HSO83813.1 FUN14 domain-containing protein [Thiocapsa sp.]